MKVAGGEFMELIAIMNYEFIQFKSYGKSHISFQAQLVVVVGPIKCSNLCKLKLFGNYKFLMS